MVALKAVARGLFDGRLTADDCRLLACVRVLQAIATMAIACAPLPAARRALAGIRPLAIVFCGARTEARIVWAFDASARWRIGRARCLARAMAAEVLLPPTQPPLRVVIGVSAPAGGLLKSHAWIERDGQVLIGGNDGQYAPLVAWNCSTT